MTHHRFLALDGMRGLAAIAVLLFHLCVTQASWIFPRGYLAVDLFFIISGFVIAYAYEDRLKKGLEPSRFIAARFIRLYPLILAGAVLGAIGYSKVYDKTDLAIIFITGLLLIPTPLSPESEDFMAIPVNPPSWSLFYEIAINIVFMAVAKHLSNRVLAAILAVSALALVAAITVFGGATFGAKWSDFAAGTARVGFSFFAGVAIFRLWQTRSLPALPVPFPVLLALLLVIFQIPRAPGFDVIFDSSAVLIVFPVIVACGTRVTLSRRAAVLCALGGNLSYPVYILQGGVFPHLRELPHKFGVYGAGALTFILAATLIYLVACFIALKIYDEPVRAFLGHRLRHGHRRERARIDA